MRHESGDERGQWPEGLVGLYWRTVAALFAKPPSVAGDPMAELVLTVPNRREINGSMFELDQRVQKPDEAMNDVVLGRRLWDDLAVRTGLVTA